MVEAPRLVDVVRDDPTRTHPLFTGVENAWCDGVQIRAAGVSKLIAIEVSFEKRIRVAYYHQLKNSEHGGHRSEIFTSLWGARAETCAGRTTV